MQVVSGKRFCRLLEGKGWNLKRIEANKWQPSYLPDCCINSRILESSGERLEQSEGMQQFAFQLVVAVHGQDGFAARTNNAPGALDNRPAKGGDFAETPKRGPFGRSAASTSNQVNL